jgi:glutathione S-transferase
VKLYSYFRSSAAYRTRIALNLKGLAYETVSIHLTKDGGRQHAPEFRAVNPQKRVPALALDSGEVLLQSLAIIEYLDEVHPDPPLLPKAPIDYLRHAIKADQAAVQDWYAHWIAAGFEAIEALIEPGPYAFGGNVTLADVFIVPQVTNAHRFKVPLDRFPNIVAVDAALNKLPAFDAARPERQPDAE